MLTNDLLDANMTSSCSCPFATASVIAIALAIPMQCLQGFQQQDSHELLRVLLDGLQTEEAKAIAAQLKHESPQQVILHNQPSAPLYLIFIVHVRQKWMDSACGSMHSSPLADCCYLYP